jgi:hypothetical protein
VKRHKRLFNKYNANKEEIGRNKHPKEGRIMQKLKVTFFKALNVQSKTRSVLVYYEALPNQLTSITELMRPDEFFACFHDSSGSVIALDKNGVCVTV